MKNYYAEFLQTKISGNTPTTKVSKVSKGQNQKPSHTSDTFDTALPLENQETLISRIHSGEFVDFYNGKVDRIQNNGLLMRDFETILEERKSILMVDSNLSDAEAETIVTNLESVRSIVLSL